MTARGGSGPVRRTGQRVAYGIARRLSPRRAESFLAVARAAASLLGTRRAASGDNRDGGGKPRHREPRIDTSALARANLALERGDVATAASQAEALERRYPTSTRVLGLRRRVLAKRGNLRERAAVLHRIHLLSNDPPDVAAERAALGRLIETEPGWLPTIPGPTTVLEPAGEDVVLHLLKASVPYATTGFTMRQRYNFLAALAAGVKPVAVTELGFPRDLGITEFPMYDVQDGVPHYRLDLGPLYPSDRPVDLQLQDQVWQIARVVRKVRPAVIHASSGHRGYEYALIGQALRAQFGIPLVYEVRSFFEASWTSDEDLQEQGEQYERRFDTENRTMQAADHVLTIAEAMRDEMVERGIDADRITVVPNGVDVEVFKPMAADRGLQVRWGLDGFFTFGYVSNIDHPREGHELLIDATKVLLSRGRRVRCLIVGEGKRADDVRLYARQSGVREAVIFTGLVPHDEVPSYYALMDAFVVPRRDERFARVVTPLKPYEALAMARPMIVSDLPSHREIAAPDERGLAFPAGDPVALADTIERLMDDPALAARIGEAGRAWVASSRRWVDNGPRFREAYRKAIEHRHRQRRPAA